MLVRKGKAATNPGSAMKSDHMLYRLADGDQRAIAWIIEAAGVCVRSAGALPLESCAGLATTPASRRQAVRDAALCSAAYNLGQRGEMAPPLALFTALEQFKLEHWPAWQRLSKPPVCASPVQQAFWAALKSGPVPGTPQGIGRILRSARN